MDRAGEADTRRAMWWGDVGLVLAFLGGFLCAPLFFVHFVYPFFR
jgi:hypothetical protein